MGGRSCRGGKQERSKHGHTNNKAQQHDTPKAVEHSVWSAECRGFESHPRPLISKNFANFFHGLIPRRLKNFLGNERGIRTHDTQHSRRNALIAELLRHWLGPNLTSHSAPDEQTSYHVLKGVVPISPALKFRSTPYLISCKHTKWNCNQHTIT